MTTIVRSSEFVSVPEALVGRIQLLKAEPGPYEEGRYQVLLLDPTRPNGPAPFIGHVAKFRTESWRKSGRIRTSLIGRPIHWEARLVDGRSVGYHFYQRNAAAVALAEAFLDDRPDAAAEVRS